MLARLESTLPRGPEWRYEPKLDGFRGLLWRSNTSAARVLSRNLKDLSVSFPELVRAAEALPLDTVIDGVRSRPARSVQVEGHSISVGTNPDA